MYIAVWAFLSREIVIKIFDVCLESFVIKMFQITSGKEDNFDFNKLGSVSSTLISVGPMEFQSSRKIYEIPTI